MRKTFRLLLTLALTAMLVAGLATTSSASNHQSSHAVHFPWVPNGAMLGDSGPYYGAITIQNLEGAEISVYVVPLSRLGGGEPPTLLPWTLGPHASLTLTSPQIDFGDGVPGSGVLVHAEFTGTSEPARIAGVQKQTAAEPPAASSRTTQSHMTAGGYTGLSSSEIDTGAVLPIVQTNSGWNTVIRVTNFDLESSSNTVRLTLREAGGATAPLVFTEVLGSGDTWTFDLLERGLGAEWVGSAVISADGNVGAVAERVKPSTNMLIMNQSQMPTSASSKYAPLILREWNNWNAGISIANLSDDANLVTVDYYGLDGTLLDSDEVNVPPRGMNFIFTPAGVAGNGEQETGFVGAARISGNGPLHAAVDQVKYFGGDDDTGHAMSYLADTRPGLVNNYIAMPLVQKGDPQTGLGNTTGIQLVSPLNSPSTAKLWFLDELGNIVSPEPEEITLEGRAGVTIYTMDFDYLPSGFQGSAYIWVTSGEILAVANNVDYQVQFDGSASMNLVQTGGLFHATEIELTASPNPVPHFSQATTVSARVTDRFGEPVPSGHAVVISIDNTSAAGINFGPGAPSYASSGPVTTDSNGVASIEVQLRDSALGDRPVSATVTATYQGVEQNAQIQWNPPPELAP
jgi:hypothetical protein